LLDLTLIKDKRLKHLSVFQELHIKKETFDKNLLLTLEIDYNSNSEFSFVREV